MVTNSKYSNASPSNTSFEATWRELCPRLLLLTRRLVYSFRIPSWRGQEDDVVEDIVQETARRIIERAQKAENGEAPPIHMFERMVITIASNYCKDIRRRDCRLIRLTEDTYSPDIRDLISDRDNVDLSEEATESLYQEALFRLLAQEIIKLPNKQRKALLIDLANRMCFETQPTPLQKAFLDVGIHLQEYQQPLPNSSQERRRYAAILHCAYKRIAHLSHVQQYVSVA